MIADHIVKTKKLEKQVTFWGLSYLFRKRNIQILLSSTSLSLKVADKDTRWLKKGKRPYFGYDYQAWGYALLCKGLQVICGQGLFIRGQQKTYQGFFKRLDNAQGVQKQVSNSPSEVDKQAHIQEEVYSWAVFRDTEKIIHVFQGFIHKYHQGWGPISYQGGMLQSA